MQYANVTKERSIHRCTGPYTEALSHRLRAESDSGRRAQTSALADRHATETKEAKARADKAERAAAAATRAEAAASDRAVAAEANLAVGMS